jgi:hypothetical protein
MICLYVDDLLVTGSNQSGIEKFKHTMQCEFEMTDLGRLSYFLGLEFKASNACIIMHQQKYIGELLERFNMVDCNTTTNPSETNAKLDECKDEERVEPTEFKQIVGSLRYLSNRRPDIFFAVSIISRFMNDPKKSHLTAAKRILRYVKGTLKLGLLFPTTSKEGTTKLEGYSNSDWCGDKMDRRSTFGYLFKFNDAAISWCTKKQPVTALSSCEAEYIACTFATCQAI